MHFKNKETYEYAVGIYNETKDKWEIRPYFTVNFYDPKDINISVGETDYYLVGIQQTNNPNLYRLEFKNDDIGWKNNKTAFMGGSIYSTEKRDFIPGLYLFTDFIKRYGYFEKSRNIHFPVDGVYYHDYSRIMQELL